MDAEKKEAIYKTKYFVIEYLSINKNFWEDMAYATQSAYDRIILIRIEQLEKAMYAKPNLFFNFMIEVLIGPFAGFLIGKVVKTFLNSSFKIFTSISPSLKPMVQTEETKYLSSLDQVVAFKTLNKLPKAERDERIAALSPYTDALQMPKNIEGLNEMWKQMKSGGYKVAKDFIKAGKKESSSADYSDLVTLKDTFQNMCLNASRFFQRKLNHFESLWEFQDWEAVKIEDIKQAAEFVNQNMNLK